MLPNERPQSGSLNVAHLHNSALNLVEAACGVVSRPLELVLRPCTALAIFRCRSLHSLLS